MMALCLAGTREGRAARRGERDVVKLTTAQVAERLGVTPRRVRALIAAGRLKAAQGRPRLPRRREGPRPVQAAAAGTPTGQGLTQSTDLTAAPEAAVGVSGDARPHHGPMKISRRPYLKDLTAETVVVHTRDDASIRGVLLAVHSDVYVLRHAAYLNPDGSKVAIDGEVLVPASRVALPAAHPRVRRGMTVIISDGAQVRALPTSLPWSEQRHHDLQRPVRRQRLAVGRPLRDLRADRLQPAVGLRRGAHVLPRDRPAAREGLHGPRPATTASACATTTSRSCCAGRSPAGRAFDRKGELAYNLFTPREPPRAQDPPRRARRTAGRAVADPVAWVQEIRVGIETLAYKVYPGHRRSRTRCCPGTSCTTGSWAAARRSSRCAARSASRTRPWTGRSRRSTTGPACAAPSRRTTRCRTAPSRACAPSSRSSTAGPGGKTLGIFDQGLKFHSISQSAADAGVVETRKATREEAAAAYGIPAPMVGILDHATYSNITELRRSFYVDTVAPYLTSIEDTEQAQLIEPEPAWKREGVFTEFDMGEILKPDPLRRRSRSCS